MEASDCDHHIPPPPGLSEARFSSVRHAFFPVRHAFFNRASPFFRVLTGIGGVKVEGEAREARFFEPYIGNTSNKGALIYVSIYF